MQATYISKEILTSVHVSWPGPVHDSTKMNKLNVGVKMAKVDDAVLLSLRTVAGDNIFFFFANLQST
jgi:hypothetical protein